MSVSMMEESRGGLERTGGSQVLDWAEEKGNEMGGRAPEVEGGGLARFLPPWSALTQPYLYGAPDSWL